MWEFRLVAGPYEGPTGGVAWDGEGVLFSLIGESRILRYDPRTGSVMDFRRYTNRINGLVCAPDGRLYGCQSGSRRVVRFDPDGSTRLLAYQLGSRFHNYPKDLTIDRQGRIWFSDPHSDTPAPGPQVALLAPLDHASVLLMWGRPNRALQIKRMTFDTKAPAGVAISQDQKTLFVAESDYRSEGKRELRAYPIQADDTLGPYSVLHTFGRDHRGPQRGIEGMCLDSEGNIVAAAGWQRSGPGPLIYVFSPSGRVLETHPVPADEPMNCTFGDSDLSTLYVTTGGGHLYRVFNTGRKGSPLLSSG